MSCGVKADLALCKGKTFSEVFRWGQERLVYRTIATASNTAPLVFATSIAHGLTTGWPYRIQGAEGMEGEDPQTKLPLKLNTDVGIYREALVIDATQIEINEIDATDFSAYVPNSAQLVYHLPVDIAGYTARMQVRETADSDTVVLELTTENGGITVNNTTKTITLTATAAATSALAEMRGVYELEMIVGSEVTLLSYGDFEISAEVTR